MWLYDICGKDLIIFAGNLFTQYFENHTNFWNIKYFFISDNKSKTIFLIIDFKEKHA